MAVLFDTTVAVLLARSGRGSAAEPRHRTGRESTEVRSDPSEVANLMAAARSAVEAGTAVLPAVAISELMVGERDGRGGTGLRSTLERLPTVLLPVDAALDAGAMGSFLRSRGQAVPLPDLLIAATALWLDLVLLTWDGDFARGRAVAAECGSEHEGARLWRKLRLHPASRGGSSSVR